ncbi:diguanylate cyclase [Sphaerospermopsis aphanizomenoides BCCUSP55]|uniref:diguanylate cyclase domain-containing protein n=1 Tax=Sphaerospermopsis aphanizomenoides TaxID=459663 RepID=UPI00190893F6|nr:diguanylate cyclase [Sphaerospermopsis aphanizomenoides]MBK1989034.1 diguanylate cyclase [Sphaerospermopsis aphanizomenoides BCCUSP55]
MKNKLAFQQVLYQNNLLSHITARTSHSLELPEILAATVGEIRSFLQVDRVKIYRFDADGSGDVVAESIEGDRLPSLLGLHFPASDIPPQARELFITARQRIIVDVASGRKTLSQIKSVGTLKNQSQEDIRYKPVDPCHLQYLKTMGVAASLAMPILYQNYLWGLMVAHHTQPRPFTEQDLQIVQLLVDQLLIAIAQFNLLAQARQQAKQEAAISYIKNLLATSLDHKAILEHIVNTLGASGGRIYIATDMPERPAQIYTWGEQPNHHLIEESKVWQNLMGWQGVLAVSHRQPSEVIRTWEKNECAINQPGAVYSYTIADFCQDTRLRPLVTAFASTSIKSVLIIPLQYQQQHLGCLTLFRPEIETETLWAGRCNPDERNLRPRESFAAWREIKTGQAQPWSQSDIKLAQAFGMHLYIAVMQQRVENLLHHHTSCDILTGLPNRLLFDKLLALALVNIHQQGGMLAVMFLDLDRFKTINDSLGHAVGDRLLQSVAERIKSCLQEGDTVARWGDDEFTLLLPQITCANDATAIAQKLLDVLSQPFQINKQELHITASIGIALAPYDGEEAETLLKHADTTLNRAKQQGKNNYLLYTATMNATSFERLVLGNNLYKALGRQELLLHYQPQIDLKTGHIIGMEALLRWHHPDMGLVSPAQFIPLAEETGLICDIGEWVLRTACTQNRLWQLAGLPPLRVAVNLSARQFQQPNLVQTITQILQETQLEPQYLELEITESLLMEDVDFTVSALRELQALGIHISMDDFGTGYSSLSLLMYFPLSSLKIDQSFIRNLTKNSSNAAIITSVISLGHGLNLTLVAEGVETLEELEFLRLANCDTVQGYLLSKPLSAEAATKFLVEKSPQPDHCILKQSVESAQTNPIPSNEPQRLAALAKYQILDTPPDQTLDDLTRLAAQLCQTPIAFISLIDEQRQWLKSKLGLTITETPRAIAFCAHTICQDDVLMIPDAANDPRFATNPLVTSHPKLRFYAAAPLLTHEGFALGTLCIADYQPREINQEQQEILKILAVQVMTKLELHRNQIEQRNLQKQLHRAHELEGVQQELTRTVNVYKHTEKVLVERVNLAQLASNISSILGKHEKLSLLLQECTAVLTQYLDIAYVGIWMQNPTTRNMDLQASSGLSIYVDHSSVRIPISEFQVKWIAENCQSFQSNQLLHEPSLIDRDWAKREQLKAFAGYPLVIDHHVIGVMTIFTRQPLTQGAIDQLNAISKDVTLCIERKQTEELLRLQNQRERIVASITQRILQSLDIDEIMNTTVKEVRQFLQTDRVIIYRFKPDWTGVVAMESVANGFKPILRSVIDEPCFRDVYVPQYRQGRVRAIEDIYTAGISPCHFNLLAEYQVRANLVVPIIQGEELWGLLIAHHCSSPRHWRQIEISLLSQLATQVAIAIKQSELYQQVQRQATVDGLTQIPNRRRFDEYLSQMWEKMAQIQAPLSIILCDIDFFKVYNDTYGHPAGDDCLRQVAAAINKAGNRPDDLVARYGGEEFVIVLPNTSASGAMQVAERIRAEVKALQIKHEQSLVSEYVTLSIGVANIVPSTNSCPGAVIGMADEALYQAKAEGRDRLRLKNTM